MVTRRQALVSLAGGLSLLPAPLLARGREVNTAFGPVAVPDMPRRIVTLDSAGAVALNHGLIPVGTTRIDARGLMPGVAQRAAEVPLIGQSTYDGQLNFEKILALSPDLIIGMIRGGGNYAPIWRKLSRIAPTVFLQANGAGQLLDVTHALAQAMGLGAESRAARDAYQQALARARLRHAAALSQGPLAVMSGRDHQVTVFAANSWPGRVLTDLGARLPGFVAGAAGNAVALSYEQVSRLQECGGLIYPAEADGLGAAPDAAVLRFWNLPGFQGLPAVKDGNMLGLRDLWPETWLSAQGFLRATESLLAHMKETG